MKLPDFQYFAPATAKDVVQLLASHQGKAKVIAGGQSLLPVMAFRLIRPVALVDLCNVKGLSEIKIDASGVRLGARTRWRDIEDDKRLRDAHPLLMEAIRHVAHYQVRNRGTVGGSLGHADPASEMPCIAATCEAELRLLGPQGERCLKAVDYFVGPLTTALRPDEIILEVNLPAWPAGRRWGFREFVQRPGDFALAGVAFYCDLDSQQRACNAHIGVLGACQYPARLSGSERVLNGKRLDPEIAKAVGRVAAQEATPSGDFHAPVEYRKALVGTLLQRVLTDAST
jgi:carbon-monoxide dehydrogenase medium subunit